MFFSIIKMNHIPPFLMRKPEQLAVACVRSGNIFVGFQTIVKNLFSVVSVKNDDSKIHFEY